MDWNFEFESTYRCNTVCKYCNRLLGVIDLSENSDITPEQVRYACKMLREMRFYPVRIKISGGEPELNPHIDEICQIIAEQLKPQKLWILMNGKLPGPDGVHAKINPLPKTNHDPFLVSPIDCGLEEHQVIHACLNRSQTGGAFDCHGFTFCALAPLIGRLLRINPYSPHPIFDQDYRICRHCPLSMNQTGRARIFEMALKGECDYPTKTFREGLKQYHEEPFVIPRLEVTNEGGEWSPLLEPVEEDATCYREFAV